MLYRDLDSKQIIQASLAIAVAALCLATFLDLMLHPANPTVAPGLLALLPAVLSALLR